MTSALNGGPPTRDKWHGTNVRKARLFMAQHLPAPCGQCGQLVDGTTPWVVGHVIPRWQRPDLALEPTNWRPEHRACSNRTAGPAAAAAISARHAAGVSSGRPGLSQSRAPVGVSLPGSAAVVSEPPRFDPASLEGVPWLADLLEIPPNAAWPRHMSPPHPDAVDSYGAGLEIWAAEELGITLRWWQRLAFRRQLEHDAEGALVWQTVLESGPRRIGKSTRMRVGALWRMEHGPELFGERQEVVHTGSDLAVCRKVQKEAWRWGESRGWVVTRGNGKEAMETATGDTWLVRAQDATYGWDTTLGLVDEGWDVKPAAVDEGLEPSILERSSPQLVLDSTAHRRATSLMRRRIPAALAGLGEDWRTLLLLWCAPPGAPLGEESTWRAASPHWTEARRQLIADKYERAMRGEADPEADDPDPIEGFRAQYLNVWPPAAGQLRKLKGDPVTEPGEWERLRYRPRRDRAPVVVAVEASFGGGVAVATAERLPRGRVGVSVADTPNLAAAAARARALGVPVLAGKSLLADPGFAAAEPMVARSRQAAEDLRRLIDDDVIRHDGSEVLTGQALGLRVARSAGGPRLVSTGRTDAVKAAVWATQRARVAVAESPKVF